MDHPHVGTRPSEIAAEQVVLENDKPSAQTSKVWQDTCRYLYMPRLASSEVFLETIRDGLMSKEWFGYAAEPSLMSLKVCCSNELAPRIWMTEVSSSSQAQRPKRFPSPGVYGLPHRGTCTRR